MKRILTLMAVFIFTVPLTIKVKEEVILKENPLTVKDFGTAPDYEWPVFLKEMKRVENSYQTVLITYEEMELTSLGTYYITAYCPAECGGSWMTASGATCHRADDDHRLSQPTTAAISRSIHSFGTEFYIPAFDRTFIAEDTGPGVQGKHLDLFYEEYGDVLSFPTGYYEVFRVEWVTVTKAVTEEELKEIQNKLQEGRLIE